MYDVVVVGGGAAGCMAAICAGGSGRKTALVERNSSVGKKIKLTGKGRCNITNTADIDAFVEAFGKEGKFLRSAFLAFFNWDLIDFFASKGLELVPERQGRVFPIDYKALSVVRVLQECLRESSVEIISNTRVLSLEKKDTFELKLENNLILKAKKVILTTGGVSFKKTGSTGDGYRFAEKLGHTIEPLVPGLVPLKTKELWVKEVQGLTLKNVRITFLRDGKKLKSRIGELLFTHFGISGPLILDSSGSVAVLLKQIKEIQAFIDLKPALSAERIEEKLLEAFATNGASQLIKAIKNFLPQSLIPVIIGLSGAKAREEASQVKKEIRQNIGRLLKALPLTITGTLGLEEAMVTGGGVSTKEIKAKTMESKLIPGLYFAGEIIDGFAQSGGYNLQQAFSTGYLAGKLN